MPLTPQITLEVSLVDASGNEIGTAGNPAYVRIILCNFGPFLPRITGTSMIAGISLGDIPYLGVAQNIKLWGNDVIIPAGTYYAISILDSQKNVIQSGAYVFTGTATIDLSSQSPTFPSYTPSVMGSLVTIPFIATPQFNCALVDGPIAFDLTLSGNVTSSLIVNPFAGQIVTFIISQNGAGGFIFTWPPNVENPGIVDSDPNSVTSQTFIARANGNLYPIGPPTFS